MTQTLGQVAFEEFWRFLAAHDQGSAPSWDESTGLRQRAWQAAAEAVVKQHMMELTGADDYQWGTFELDAHGAVISQDSGVMLRGASLKERAVIEAARAFQQAFDRPYGGLVGDLVDALEALEEVEDE